MKALSKITATLMLTFLIIACSKDKTTTTQSLLVGNWRLKNEGAYAIGTNKLLQVTPGYDSDYMTFTTDGRDIRYGDILPFQASPPDTCKFVLIKNNTQLRETKDVYVYSTYFGQQVDTVNINYVSNNLLILSRQDIIFFPTYSSLVNVLDTLIR